jgi:hypothetical protein
VKTLCGILLAFALSACGSDGVRSPENYGNILDTPAGLILVQEEHPDGWGRPDCLVCHIVPNMHVVNRTGLPDNVVNLQGIQDVIAAEGQASCARCHGNNGVQP